jgi:gamma-butyrobetaine dioxygenase
MSLHIEKSQNETLVYLQIENQSTELPALWLRERVLEADQVDQKTAQRLFNPHLLDCDISITAASHEGESISISFSDGHDATFELSYLQRQAQSFNSGIPDPISWVASDQLNVKFDWQILLQDRGLFIESVEAFLRYGYLILHNTPTASDSILDIAQYYGHIRDTNFGRFFQVYSKPNPNDLAYTPYAIGPHTDNPYRDPVPGIQLLHCLNNQTDGGYSTLADGFSIVEALRQQDPISYKLLTETVVRFRFFDTDTELVSFHPLIEKDPLGNVLGIHYSPRLDDLPLLPTEQLKQYQAARKKLGEMLEDSHYEKKFKLLSGELMMFDNNRVLHGRTQFDPQQGERHLQGCYIDRDAPKSIYRIATKQH